MIWSLSFSENESSLSSFLYPSFCNLLLYLLCSFLETIKFNRAEVLQTWAFSPLASQGFLLMTAHIHSILTRQCGDSFLPSLPCLTLNTCKLWWVTKKYRDRNANFNIRGLKWLSLSQNPFHLSIWPFSQFQKPCKHPLFPQQILTRNKAHINI